VDDVAGLADTARHAYEDRMPCHHKKRGFSNVGSESRHAGNVWQAPTAWGAAGCCRRCCGWCCSSCADMAGSESTRWGAASARGEAAQAERPAGGRRTNSSQLFFPHPNLGPNVLCPSARSREGNGLAARAQTRESRGQSVRRLAPPGGVGGGRARRRRMCLTIQK